MNSNKVKFVLVDELIQYLTELRCEVGNVEVTILSDDGNKERSISGIYIDTDIDCAPYIVIE